MNALEHFVCASSLWRGLTQRHVLPWLLSGARLGDHVLDIGAGYGAATPDLRKRVSRVTALEYDANSVRRMQSQHSGDSFAALQGDAAELPFADQTFSSAISILVLHHLKSRELQDRMFAEAFRVLRPGGVFLAAEINDTWLNRAVHYKSTFTPLTPGSAFARLSAAGFSRISVDMRGGGFRISASRAKEQPVALPGQSQAHAANTSRDRDEVPATKSAESTAPLRAHGVAATSSKLP
ncbi:MAG TPA: class I SAM-dependent methyltransferase [Candidatus Acidoferrum sp.]